MIVKCEQCQTRFKIPDDKVTDKGVKVRCTKCQHTFRVTREGQAPATAQVGAHAPLPATAQMPAYAPPPVGAPPDPFAQFGSAYDVGHDEMTRPGMVRPGLNLSPAPFSDPFDQEDAPTRVGPLPAGLGAMLRPPKGPLGLGGPAAPALGAPDPFAALGAEPLPPTRQQPARAADLARGAPSPFAGAAAPDPFASFGTPAPLPAHAVTLPSISAPAATGTQPAMRAPGRGGAVFSVPPGSDPSGMLTQPQPAFPGAYGAPAPEQSWADGDAQSARTFTGKLPTTQKNPAFAPLSAAPPAPAADAAEAPPGGMWDFAAGSPAEPAASASPFDFSPAPLRDDSPPAPWIAEPGEPATEQPWKEAAPPPAPPPADAGWGAAPGAAAPEAAAWGAAPAPEEPPPAEDPFALPGSMPSAAGPFTDGAFNAGSPPEPEAAPAFQAPAHAGDPFGDLPREAAPPPADRAPAAFDASAPQDASSLFGAAGTSLSADFEPPPPVAPPEPAGFDLPHGESPSHPMGRLDLQKKPAHEVAAALHAAAAEAEGLAPAGAEQARPPPSLEKPPRPRSAVVGLVANILTAAVLLVLLLAGATAYFNEGKLDLSALSWTRLQEFWAPQKTLVAVDISNGLYETRAGHSVFFVRGEVLNRSGKDVPVIVRAEIYDGEQMVRFAQGFAGATPNPEDLHAIAAADDVERLNERLKAQVQPVAAGKSGLFLVPFYEYPADLKGIRVKVLVSVADLQVHAAAP